MSGAPTKKPQSEKELKTARTLNTVATIGAGHALYAMTPEKKRLAVRNKLLKVTPKSTRAGTEKFLNTLKQPELGGKLTTAGKVVAGGWLGLHSAELAGDVMARRSINNQLAQARNNNSKVDTVKKNDQSMISKAEGAVSRNGHGSSLVEKKGVYAALSDYSDKNRQNKDEFLASRGGGRYNTIGSGTIGGLAGGYIGSEIGRKKAWKLTHSNPSFDAVKLVSKPSKKNIAIGAGIGAAGAAGLANIENAQARHRHAKRTGVKKSLVDVAKAYHGEPQVSKGLPSSVNYATSMSAHTDGRLAAYNYGRAASRKIAELKKKGSAPRIIGMRVYDPLESIDSSIRSGKEARTYSREAIAGKEGKSSYKASGVGKAYRRFDPEADRQRRAGLYTGLGVLGAGLAGREASNHFTTRAVIGQNKARGIVAKPGKGKIGLGLAAASGLSGAFAARSYKSGLSSRNQPWT